MVNRFLNQAAGAALSVVGLVAAPSSHAEPAYPAKPVELIVMFPAGSSADVVARMLAEGMTKQLGQPVLVNNKPGAGGAIAYKYVQASKPDGYTLIFNSNSVSTVHYSGLTTFDYKAFDAVARVTVENPVLAVKGDAPWNNLKDLVAYAKMNPGGLRLGNSGAGSHTHITAAAFFGDQSVEPMHVPFATAQVTSMLLGGHIDALVQLPSALAPHVKAGSIKVIGVLSTKRDPTFPTIPTAMEQGMNFQADMWRGVAAARGTPPPILARLEQAIRKTVDTPEFKALGERNGFIAAYQPGRDFENTIATEDAVLAKLMTRVGLKTQ